MDLRPGGCIAVVDDDRSILQSLASLLESADYGVRLFASGLEFLRGSHSPSEIDCVIADIDMPGLDGFELIRRIHAMRPQLPVILITGHLDRLTRLPSQTGGAFRLFTKPFQGHELLKVLADALSEAPE